MTAMTLSHDTAWRSALGSLSFISSQLEAHEHGASMPMIHIYTFASLVCACDRSDKLTKGKY